METVAETSSTNADVSERFRTGEAEGLVLAADHQTQGRGRLGREWVTPAGTSLTVSFLLVPDVPAELFAERPEQVPAVDRCLRDEREGRRLGHGQLLARLRDVQADPDHGTCAPWGR